MVNHSKRYYHLLLPAMLLCMAGPLFAQNDTTTLREHMRFGLFGGWQVRSEFIERIVPGFGPDCGELTEGSGTGLHLGLTVDFPQVLPFPLQARAGFSHLSGRLSHRGNQFPVRLDDGSVVNGRVDEVLDYSSTGLTAEILANIPLSSRLNFTGGIGSWFRLLTQEHQREIAVDPPTLLLVNEAREFEYNSGVLLDYRPYSLYLTAGGHYDLPIGSNSYFSPEVLAQLSLTDWTATGSWKSFSLQFGGSLRFGLPASNVPPEEGPQLDTVPPPPVLAADIRTSPKIVLVEITQYDSTEALPLLNRLFFEQGEAGLPERYRRLTPETISGFSTRNLNGSILEVYHDVLNVVGLRMKSNPDAIIQIVGHRNGLEPKDGLDRQRAANVAAYLHDVWGIESSRMKVVAGGTPPSPASERTPEGLEENAVVRILPVNDLNIIIPVFRQYIKRFATPPSVTFYPKTIAEAGLDHWSLEILGDTEIWRTFEGNGAIPDSVRWDWRSDSGELPGIPIELSYRLQVQDSAGQSVSTPRTSITVQMKTDSIELLHIQQDTIIESYSLLLFDYDSPKLSDNDRELIRAIVGRVSSGATVRFTGLTDSLGNNERNLALAAERAAEAVATFREFAPPGVSIVITPKGSERKDLPFDTPEGRSYSRTVIIEVRTPARHVE